MKMYKKIINSAIKSLNWKKIKKFHQLLDIKWEMEDRDGNIIEKCPTIAELKEELTTLLYFVINKDIKVLDYGNWLIFWSNEEAESEADIGNVKLEVIFVLDECLIIGDKKFDRDIDDLEKDLEKAIRKEDYEKAARIRDEILNKKNKIT